jgi:hypothetical protein
MPPACRTRSRSAGYRHAYRLDALESPHQVCIANWPATDADAFVVMEQMWRAIQARMRARLRAACPATGSRSCPCRWCRQRLRHGQPGGAGRGDRQNRPDPLQTEFDRMGTQRLLPPEPLRKGAHDHGPQAGTSSAGGACLSSLASNRAISSRNCRRSTIMSSAPCSSRNSLRWKPSGSVSRTVC